MSDKISTGDFNYGSVDEETAGKLEYFAKSGKALLRKTQIQFVADMGKILSEARDLLASHDKNKGKFIRWATAEFDVSPRTVWNYVNAWDRMLCNDCTTYLNWTQTAVYLASSEELPKPVQKKLAAMASKDMVRESDVKRLIEASKPKPEPPDDYDPFNDGTETTPVDPAAEKVKAKADAAAAKAKEKEEAAKAKEKAKAEAAAEKLKAKEEAAAAKAQEKADKEAAKAASLTTEGQIKNLKNLIQQHIDKAVRLIDDLHRMKPNNSKRMELIRVLQGVKTW